jgi:hypothetical protein
MKIVVCVVFSLCFFSVPSRSQISFAPATTYEAGAIAKWVGVADFDGDGNPDLAISQPDSSRVVVLFGRGDGTFPWREMIPLASPPDVGATSDLNGDGHADLVLATSTGVVVLMGKGDGTFLPPQLYPTQSKPWGSLEIADLDNDGKPDLVFPDFGQAVHVLWQDAQGGFAAESTYATSGEHPDDVVVGDLNHDGYLDVATSDYGHAICCWHISVLLNQGGRSFLPAAKYNDTIDPISICTADLDRNGSLDLLSAGDMGGFTVLINRGDGSFDPTYASGGEGTDALWDTKIVDLDREGNPDLVEATQEGVLINRGIISGQFVLTDTLIMSTVPRSIVPADLNHDMRPDLVTAGVGATVFLNQTPTVSATPHGPLFAFDAPRPNPARHDVSFDFSLPGSAKSCLAIYDPAGRHVATLAMGRLSAGAHRVSWNLQGQAGRRVGAGVYFARLDVGLKQIVRRIEVLP